MGMPERVGGTGIVFPVSNHLWRVWTGCDKCGMGWCHTVEQLPSGIESNSRDEPLPMMSTADFVNPGASNYGFRNPWSNPREVD